MAAITVSGRLGANLTSTATITQKSRNNTKVVLNISISTHLQYSSSWLGTGYTLTGTVTAYGKTKNITVKSSSASWSGTAKHTNSTTFSITVPATTTTITVGYKLTLGGTGSGSLTGTNKSLSLSKVVATMSSATAFSDTTDTTIKFKNPSGFKLRPYLDFYNSSGALALRVFAEGVPSTGSSIASPYTWSLTDTQRNEIRDALKNESSVKCSCGIFSYSGSTYINNSWVNVTFTNVLIPPIFTNFIYEDIGGETITENVTTLDLTGDSSKIIKGYSKVRVTISGDNKAIAHLKQIDPNSLTPIAALNILYELKEEVKR